MAHSSLVRVSIILFVVHMSNFVLLSEKLVLQLYSRTLCHLCEIPPQKNKQSRVLVRMHYRLTTLALKLNHPKTQAADYLVG